MFTEVTIGDLGQIITGKTPPTSKHELFGNEFPFITPTDIDGVNRTVVTERGLSKQGYNYQPKYLLPPNSVCVVCIGATIGKICITSEPSFTNQQINSIVVDIGNYDPLFVFYLLRLQSDRIKAVSGGAATPIINKTVFSDINVNVPPLPTQHTIASILSAYDDLIENNTRRIKILEEMAQSIYREWFVNFHFPGHEKVRLVNSKLGKIPEGWNILNLFDIAEVTYGFPFKSRLFSSKPSGLPVVRIRDINLGYSSTYTPEEVDSKYILESGDILVGMDGNFNMCKWAGGAALLNQRVVRFRPKAAFGRYHLYLALKAPIHFFDSTVVGTTVAHLSDEDLRSIDVPLPRSNDTKLIYDTFEPLLDLEINLRMKNTLLRQARDLLLPHLIFGELDVSDFDIVINDSGGN